jgi:hypothetical protein
MIGIEEAQQIAAREVERRQQTSAFWHQVDDLSAVRLDDETPEFWIFFARSQQLIDASHAPGGMCVTVDKQTGRIWTPAEIEAYYEARAAARQPIAA